jgi:hypothetical protein
MLPLHYILSFDSIKGLEPLYPQIGVSRIALENMLCKSIGLLLAYTPVNTVAGIRTQVSRLERSELLSSKPQRRDRVLQPNHS